MGCTVDKAGILKQQINMFNRPTQLLDTSTLRIQQTTAVNTLGHLQDQTPFLRLSYITVHWHGKSHCSNSERSLLVQHAARHCQKWEPPSPPPPRRYIQARGISIINHIHSNTSNTQLHSTAGRQVPFICTCTSPFGQLPQQLLHAANAASNLHANPNTTLAASAAPVSSSSHTKGDALTAACSLL